ncbi:MAG: class I SAM-dependent methyltransferase [Chromatiales bacterium]|nr:class I SAM-dependent methyltransferase [Chromatiales bacterium]
MSLDVGDPAFEQLVESGQRFKFGKNWRAFLRGLNEGRIVEAERSLKDMLGVADLAGTTFLDIGSGSGLFSLAARRLGARVHSFDFDPDSVACTRALRENFFPDDPQWTVERGSALDPAYLASLGTFDVVYAWGVLHHTGEMWSAIDNATHRVRPGGSLFLMIYRDWGLKSRIWLRIKRTYCSGAVGRWAVLALFIPYYVVRGVIEDVVRLRNPWARYREYQRNRGMSKFHDWIDWLGGYPYEFATIEQVEAFCEQRGLVITRQEGEEYVFRRPES